MEQQDSRTTLEKIQTEVEKQGNFVISLFWFAINFIVLISVIALLYTNGFTGASILLYKLFLVWITLVIVITFVWAYIAFINMLIRKAKPRQEKRRLEFKQELKKEILKELNGRRKK